MPKDFAKKKSKRKAKGASRQNNSQSVPLALWLLTFTMVGLFGYGLIYIKWLNVEPKNAHNQVSVPREQVTQAKINTAKTEPKTPSTKATNKDQIPLYNLHNDLIHKEVTIPEEDLKLPANHQNVYYSMPCGSFRESFRAEELKAQIALTGNNSSVSSVSYKGETWYRVQLGPFSRKRSAESVRHRLEDNNIVGCVINRHIKDK